jgi:hypothetical protein
MVSARFSGLCVLALLLAPSFASADEDPPAVVAQRRIEKGLVQPLVQKERERSRFSRAMMPPQERRVRVTQTVPVVDGNGRSYLTFAIDVRRGPTWHDNEVVGCAYLQTGALFVKSGDAYRPAAILLGKALDAVPNVCTPATRA